MKRLAHRIPPQRLLLAGITGLICLVGMMPRAEADEGWAWRVVQRSVQAGCDVPYQGYRDVVIFRGGHKVAGFRQKVWQGGEGRRRVMIIEPPDQRGRIEVCDGQTRWEYYPRTHEVIISKVLGGDQPGPAEMLPKPGPSARLHASYLGDGRIAGRLAHIVELTTLAGRPARKLWVDREKFVQLKVQRFSPSGEIIYSAYFTTITYDPEFSPDLFSFTLPKGCRIMDVPPALPRMDLEQAELQAGFPAILPQYVPDGYELERSHVAVAHREGKPVLWLSFSNGVERFSLFQGRKWLGMAAGEQRPGKCWTAGSFCIVLVGSLPADEVQKIKKSMQK